MNLVVVGLNHRTAPVEVREKFYFPESRISEALYSLIQGFELQESLLLSTCNRVEILGVSSDAEEAARRILDFLSTFHQMDLTPMKSHLFTHTGQEAVRHIFRVTSSLDSMILGEPQILGQVKAAFNVALQCGSAGPFINTLMNRAFSVAKRVRTETAIASAAVSISYAAVELAKKIFNQLNGKTVMILGAGKMGELSVKHLKSSGVSQVLVWNRTYSRAQELAAFFGGEAVPSDELQQHLDRADILLSSTGSSSFLLSREDGERLIHHRKNRPLFIIDIAVPRDVDPEINKISNIFLYDIDDLQHVVDANRKQRLREAVMAEEIVKAEVAAFSRKLMVQDVAPTIVALREHWDSIRREEISRFQKQFGPLNENQQAAIENLTQNILNKFLHGPITTLKESSQRQDSEAQIQEIKKMLGLKDRG
jgi:glutamyl-tRNA reductase